MIGEQLHKGQYIIYKNGEEVARANNTMTSYYRNSLFNLLKYNGSDNNNIRMSSFKVGRGTTPEVETDTNLELPYEYTYTPADSIIYSDYLFTYFMIEGNYNLTINEIGMYNSSGQLLSRVVLDLPVSKGVNDTIIIQRKDVLRFRSEV